MYVSGFTFIGDGGSQHSRTNDITGQDIYSTAIISWESTIKISNIFFKNFSGSLWEVSSIVKKYTNRQNMQVGGVIIASMSNIWLYDSSFQRNTAQLGGAIFAEKKSNITIINSNFSDHITTCMQREVLWWCYPF